MSHLAWICLGCGILFVVVMVCWYAVRAVGHQSEERYP